ncbi:hypothetical protein KIN20_026818 [Parelaphostrongylus tenuis]|uniref:Uncharacterized protein n=1 Tax=Parelaphostrongylus tenuis TaxID=148309 RepID=A0AAD5WDF7_PARTN|nr:hypothetical protein KIN20_026818 [Parelaphostrongylus tenuis]
MNLVRFLPNLGVNRLTNMMRLLINPLMILVVSITAVLGCAVIPSGQSRTRNFTVSGFTLPVSMAYSEMPNVRSTVPGIAANKGAAQAFVSRLVMHTVTDVLEGQARSALLPDAIISAIISQLTIQISYEPLQCNGASVNQPPAMPSKFPTPAPVLEGTITIHEDTQTSVLFSVIL